jgi:hypothetical protein
MRSNLSSMLDLLGRHDAAVEGARFVLRRSLTFRVPCIGPARPKRGGFNRERISAFSFKLKALAGTLVPARRL